MKQSLKDGIKLQKLQEEMNDCRRRAEMYMIQMREQHDKEMEQRQFEYEKMHMEAKLREWRPE